MTQVSHEPLPATLARIDARAEQELAQMEQARKARRQRASSSAESDAPGEAMPAPRPHFELWLTAREDCPPGVYWLGVLYDKHGEVTGQALPKWICAPLEVAAQTHDGQGHQWGRLLVFEDRNGREHRWAMPMRLLAGSGEELRGELLSAGLTISSDPRLRRYLIDYITQENPAVIARCVQRTGWHGPVFVTPHQTFGQEDTQPVLFQASVLEGVALTQAGSFEGWRDGVAAVCAGNSRLVLAMSLAFAAPCLGLLGAEGGGLHLLGPSSCGKSTALAVAASVCGGLEYVRSWRQTDNALEGLASQHSDLPLLLDEMGELDAKHAGQAAYLLANGKGKGRAQRDGSPQPARHWRTLFLSSGEVSLADLMKQAGQDTRAGQEVRVLNLPADAGQGHGLFEALPQGMTAAAFADHLVMAVGAHHGHALPRFLTRLAGDLVATRQALRELRDELVERLASQAAGQVRRVAMRFALIGAAGELATRYGLTGWSSGEASRAVEICFAAWLAARGTRGNAETATMLAKVRAFLEAHGESRFTPWDGSPQRTVNRAGYVRRTPDGPEYYVEREVFQREVCTGYTPTAVARCLREIGALVPDPGGALTRAERLPDGRTARVYRILPTLWREEGI